MSLVKIVVTVPLPQADAVREAMGHAGAGKLGNYEWCSFSVRGHGRFRPIEGAHPAVGSLGTFEMVEEERIEVTCDATLVEAVTTAIRSVHPYEEPAIDLYPLHPV